ncbi:MAG: hypothetical protein M5U08_14775 [Burkholderiales bacterium]|nr:hypothetical protein [Burkholderiales bacterium]
MTSVIGTSFAVPHMRRDRRCGRPPRGRAVRPRHLDALLAAAARGGHEAIVTLERQLRDPACIASALRGRVR